MNYSGDETPVLNAPARFESPSMSDTDTATFLIDAKGVIRRIWRKVKVAGHAAEVLVNINQIQFSDSTVVFDHPASGLILDTIDFQDVVNVI